MASTTNRNWYYAHLCCWTFCGCFLSLAVDGAAQQGRQPSSVRRGATTFGPVAAEVFNQNLRALPQRGALEATTEIRPVNPREHFGREERVRRVPIPAGRRDVLLDFQNRALETISVPFLSEPILNQDGQGFSFVHPPDTVGDVGQNFYFQSINGSNGALYAIYDKSDGSIVAGPILLSDLGGPAGRGDPIVLYDHLAGRWILSEFAAAGNVLCVYVSRTGDPVAGGWSRYQFSTPHFPDYPKYGIWHDAYYVTSNERDGPAIYALDRQKMLSGEPATLQRFLAPELTGFGFQALTPVDVDGPGPPPDAPFYVMRHRDDEVHNFGANDSSQDFLDLFEIDLDWSDPSNSTLTGPSFIPISEFDSHLNGLTSFNCFPQKGSTVKLDALREVIMWRLQYRNFATHEAIVGSFVTDVDGADHGGVRWFELRKTEFSNWRVHQEGTYAPDSAHRWMSSIAMDGQGNIALAFNITSSNMYPGIRYVGRLASDPMGTMPQPERVLVEGSAANGYERYGDYSSLSVDPVDDRMFWFTGEHSQSASWSTRIGTFQFQRDADAEPGALESIRGPSSMESRLQRLERELNQMKKRIER